jgi:sugar lactone lactonase YvrE
VRRTALTMLMAGVLALVGGGVVAADPARPAGDDRFPDRIALPDGFQPEGISIGKGSTFYVGSVATGAIYRGSVRTGQGSVIVQGGTGQAAIGTEVDNRERLWVAGGATGLGRVYDTKTGTQLAQWQFAPAGPATFINDVVVTRDAAYFTDSRSGVLYVVEIGRGARLASKPATLPIKGDLRIAPGNNLNGIEASPDGRTLLSVQTNTGLLFKISPRTGFSQRVDLGGLTLVNGDGLLLQSGRTLYVVQNRSNQIAVIKLDRGFASGKQVDLITSPGFDVPTTVAAFGKYLYAVNARFGTTDPPPAEYWVTRVDRYR